MKTEVNEQNKMQSNISNTCCENNNNPSELSEMKSKINKISDIADREPVAKKPRINTIPAIHASPKKRLNIPAASPSTPSKEKPIYRYGNYSRYYGYRNTKDFHDVRLDVFLQHKDDFFADKEILDIGCNVGLLTMSVAKELAVKHITGVDIDRNLINRAKKFIQKNRREFQGTDKSGFPFNITFVSGNYVVRNPILLEIEERNQFDLILCLSVTKWIHLNFGDAGLKLAFKRMYRQLRTGGRLVLEPQPWKSYYRRKKLTPEIAKNFQDIVFRPRDFSDYLLSSEVGFRAMSKLEIPRHDVKAFQRPIQIFIK